MNPFKYGQIVKESDFCQRPNLTKKLTNNIKQSQNVYIQGERRTGKSSLICEAVRKLKKYRMLYIDLLEVKSIDDLIKRMVTAIISMESAAGFVEKTFKALSQLRPVASIDPITSMPTLAIDARTKLSTESINAVMDLIESRNMKSKPLVVVFDEFQDILNLKDAKATLAILRSKAQFHSNIPYIFAGSIRSKMDTIFNDPDSAFFKSAIPIQVGPISKANFREFLIEKFKTGRRSIKSDLLNLIFKICFNVPGDVQQLCSAFWETTSYGDSIQKDGMIIALEQIFAHEYKGYETTLKIITQQHLKLLSALARIGGKNPMSGKFLEKSGISQPSSVQKAMNRLMNLKIIFYFEDEHRFVNPFFRAWLIYKKL
jgi:hypothetical protein